jgi:hypothetical protein
VIIEVSCTSGTMCGGEVRAWVPVGTPATRLETGYICPQQYTRYEVPDDTPVQYHEWYWQEEHGGGVSGFGIPYDGLPLGFELLV